MKIYRKILNKLLFFILAILLVFSLNSFTSKSHAHQKNGSINSLESVENLSKFGSNKINQDLKTNFPSPSSEPFLKSLENGEAVVTGEKGLYKGQVIIDASIDQVWNLLTDYDNLENYFPDVKSSQLLESNNNQKIFEQVHIITLLFINIESKVIISATEEYPKDISFSLIKGNLNSLQGSWQIKELPNNKVLITHNVEVKPNLESAEEDLFYQIYKQSLKNTLEAIKKEIEKGSLS